MGQFSFFATKLLLMLVSVLFFFLAMTSSDLQKSEVEKNPPPPPLIETGTDTYGGNFPQNDLNFRELLDKRKFASKFLLMFFFFFS